MATPLHIQLNLAGFKMELRRTILYAYSLYRPVVDYEGLSEVVSIQLISTSRGCYNESSSLHSMYRCSEITIKFLFYLQVCATLGTTGACSFDNLNEVSTICYQFINFHLFFFIDRSSLSRIQCLASH